MFFFYWYFLFIFYFIFVFLLATLQRNKKGKTHANVPLQFTGRVVYLGKSTWAGEKKKEKKLKKKFYPKIILSLLSGYDDCPGRHWRQRHSRTRIPQKGHPGTTSTSNVVPGTTSGKLPGTTWRRTWMLCARVIPPEY